MLRTGAHSLEGITIHLSLLGVDFQVHEPPELIEYVRQLTERLAAPRRHQSSVGTRPVMRRLCCQRQCRESRPRGPLRIN